MLDISITASRIDKDYSTLLINMNYVDGSMRKNGDDKVIL